MSFDRVTVTVDELFISQRFIETKNYKLLTVVSSKEKLVQNY